MRPLALAAAAAVVLAGCGGTQKPVEHKIPNGIVGYDKLVNLPRGYGIRCAGAMSARRSGNGEGVAVLVNRGGIELATAALTFSDDDAARRAYAATLSPQSRRCYADGFVAELARHYRVHVRSVRTAPRQVDGAGDEHAGTRVTVILAGPRGDVTVNADTLVFRLGSTLSFNQSIDVSAADLAPDLQLVEALS
jgi:hypothetical protein